MNINAREETNDLRYNVARKLNDDEKTRDENKSIAENIVMKNLKDVD